jgi:NTE family protein
VPHDPGRPPARTFAVLPAAEAPLPSDFVPRLSAAIAAHRSIAVVTEADFHAARGTDADPEHVDSIAWMNEQERRADVVLFVASPEADPWSRAALKQADQAVFVAQSIRFARPSQIEAFALEILPESQRRLVLLHPARKQRAEGTARWLDSRPVFLHHHVAMSADDDDIARLGRFLAGTAVGLVLSGGGAFGVAHIGVWRAMRDLGVPIDIVGGASVGSAMAAAIAVGISPEEIGPRVEQIFVRSGAMRRVTIPKYAFLDHKVLDAALQEHFGSHPIEDLWLPYFAIAANLSDMSKHVMRRGPLWHAVRASTAIPGILPAFYTSEGQMLVDGGCIDNLPFRDMHGLKTGPNLVVNVQKATKTEFHVDYNALPGRAELVRRTILPFGKRPPRAPGVVSNVMRSLLMGQADTLSGLNADDLHIRPPGLKGAGFLAWDRHKLFYEMAYKHATDEFATLSETGDPAMMALRKAAKLDM